MYIFDIIFCLELTKMQAIDIQPNGRGPMILLCPKRLVSELIPKLRFHYISLHWVSDHLPLSLNH